MNVAGRSASADTCDTLNSDSTQHACSGDAAANQAGSFFMPIKPFLSIDDQVARLENMGFEIEDRNFVASCLAETNYYRIRAYWMTFERDGAIIPETSFATVWQIYRFDEAIRLWLWKQIAPLEIKARTQFAYWMAESCGPLSYCEARFFANKDKHAVSMKAFEREVFRAQKDGVPCVVHNLQKYGQLPVWAAVEIMSMGLVSSLFGNVNRDSGSASLTASENMCAAFGVKYPLLRSWLHHLTNVRNVCGHHGRFYNRIMRVRPRMLRRDRQYACDKEFPTFLVLKRLYESSWPERWDGARRELTRLIDEYSDVDLNPMGFPEDWREVLGECSASDSSC